MDNPEELRALQKQDPISLEEALNMFKETTKPAVTLEERQAEWDREHTGRRAEENMEQYKYGRPARPTAEQDELIRQAAMPVKRHNLNPMDVYNLAKIGAQFPVMPERVPIEFERSSNNYVTLPEKEQGIHRVEFIIWKGYWICNVLIGADWHHASFPNSTSMIDFLAEGQTNKAHMWPKGRIYVEE